MRAMRFATLPLPCMFIFSFTIPLAHVRASPEEPTLIAILNTLGFTNIMETTVETFPAGEYEVTLYAEFAGSHASNELSWYTTGTSEYHVIFSGPEGGPDYVTPAAHQAVRGGQRVRQFLPLQKSMDARTTRSQAH